MATAEKIWVRASRSGLKVPLSADAGPSYFDSSEHREFGQAVADRYIMRRLADGDLIKASDDEAKALEAGTFQY